MSVFSSIKTGLSGVWSWISKLFNLSNGARIAVLTLIVLIIIGASGVLTKCHAADLPVPGADVVPGQPWVQFGIGSTIIRGYAPAISVDIAYPLPITRFKSYVQFGMADIGQSTFENQHVTNNLVWSAVFITNVVGGLDAGIGPSLMDHWLPYNGNQWNAALQLDYRFSKIPLTIAYRHWSDAGSVEPNFGRDFVDFIWRF